MCGGCGKVKTNSRANMRGRSSALGSTEETIRLEFLGHNKGPIPFKVPSGNTYRVSSTTYRFVDVLPEDVDFLIKTRKFRRVVRKVSKPAETIEVVDDTIQAQETVPVPAEPVTEQVFEKHLQSINLDTIETVKKSLEDSDFELSFLKTVLGVEQESEKPRKTVIELLENAIENHPDNSGSL